MGVEILEFQQIAFYFLCVIGTFLLGVPVAALIRGELDSEDRIPLSFIMGCVYTCLPAYWLSMLGLSMKYAAPVLLLLGIVLWIVVLKRKTISMPQRKEWFLLGVCLCAGLLALIPMVIYRACCPYGDGFTYISIADYLLDHPYQTKPLLDGYHPWLSQVYLYQIYGLRIGAQLLLSFWSAVCRQQYSIFLYAPVSGVGIALMGMAVWYFLAGRRGIGWRNVLFAVVFSAFNVSIVIWSAVFGFLPQLFGLGFMCVSLRAVMDGVEQRKSRTYAEAAIASAALCLCYSEIAPFFFLMILTWYIYRGISAGLWRAKLVSLCIMMAFSVVLQGLYFIDMLHALIIQLGAVVGGAQELDWLSCLSWLFSSASVQHRFMERTVGQALLACWTVGLMALLVFGWTRSQYDGKKDMLKEAGVVSLPFFVALIYFQFFVLNPFGSGVGNSWSLYKLVQYYSVVPFCWLFCFFGDAFQGEKRLVKVVSMLFLISMIVQSTIYIKKYSYNITRSMSEYTGSVDPVFSYMKLADHYRGEDRVLNLAEMPIPHRKILTYFLRDNKLASNWSSDCYFSVFGPPPGIDPPYAPDGIWLCPFPSSPDAVAGLLEKKSYVDVKGVQGLGPVETAGNETWTWNDTSSTYQITNYSQSSVIALSFALSCVDKDGDSYVDVYINHIFKLRKEVNERTKADVELLLSLPPGGKCEVTFLYHGDKKKEKPNGRDLILCVWNLQAASRE